jgi:surface polysaccharide O-acyltransferase-like enzyme
MQRNTTVDLARVLAAYGVVALHIPFSTRAAEWITIFFWPLCVPFFYTASLVYFIGAVKKMETSAVVAKTWARIGVPYLAWTVVYVGLLLIKSSLFKGPQAFTLHNPSSFDFWRVFLYGESGVQLYFLPTLVLMQVMALALYLLFAAGSRQRVTGFLFFVGAAVYLGCGIYHKCFGVAVPGIVISIALYLATAFVLAPQMSAARTKPSYIVVGLAMLLLVLILNSRGQFLLVLDAPMILPIGGIGLLLLTVGYPTCYLPSWLAQLAGLSFGIYLCHVVFLEAFEFIASRLFHSTMVYNLPFKVLEVTMIFAVSAVFVWLLRQAPLLRQLFLGEKVEQKAGRPSRAVISA